MSSEQLLPERLKGDKGMGNTGERGKSPEDTVRVLEGEGQRSRVLTRGPVSWVFPQTILKYQYRFQTSKDKLDRSTETHRGAAQENHRTSTKARQ